MDLQQIPVAEAIFRQWVKARGNQRSQATRDFIRSWHHLEEDPFFTDAPESEIIRDLKDLAAEGWLKVDPEKYYTHRIAKVRIPLLKEAEWKEAFGFFAPDDSESHKIADYNWSPKLAFLKVTRISVPFADLKCLDDYLRSRTESVHQLPIKERSICLFGDEKRLDELYRGSLLFQEERLCLDDLDCYIVAEPLAWLRGKLPDGPVIVLENAATFETYFRWDQVNPRYSAIVYGGGSRFSDSARRINEVFEELGGVMQTIYFGDLDAAGLRIPRKASEVFLQMGFPPLLPDEDSYRMLVEIARNEPKVKSWRDLAEASEQDLLWLGPMAEQFKELVTKYGRIAQEWVNLDYLSNIRE